MSDRTEIEQRLEQTRNRLAVLIDEQEQAQAELAEAQAIVARDVPPLTRDDASCLAQAQGAIPDLQALLRRLDAEIKSLERTIAHCMGQLDHCDDTEAEERRNQELDELHAKLLVLSAESGFTETDMVSALLKHLPETSPQAEAQRERWQAAKQDADKAAKATSQAEAAFRKSLKRESDFRPLPAGPMPFYREAPADPNVEPVARPQLDAYEQAKATQHEAERVAGVHALAFSQAVNQYREWRERLVQSWAEVRSHLE